MLGHEIILALKKISEQKIEVWKYFGNKKKVGSEQNFRFEKIFVSEKNFVSEKIAEQNFGSEKF